MMAINTDGAPLAQYLSRKRVGDFIFFSGVIAVNPATKTIVNSFDDIPEEFALQIGKTGEFSTDEKIGPILSQSWYVLDVIRKQIEQENGTMEDVFKLVQYFKNLDHFPYYNEVRKLFYPQSPPVSTVVEVSEMLPRNTILIEVEATAYLPK